MPSTRASRANRSRKLRVAAQRVRQDFQRDGASERRLPHFIDKAHAVLPDESERFKLRKGGGDFRQRRRGLGFRFSRRKAPPIIAASKTPKNPTVMPVETKEESKVIIARLLGLGSF